METKTKGAWIIHHCNKISAVTATSGEYDQINFAGKCGMLLNGLAATHQVTIGMHRVRALAKAAEISLNLELPSILAELERQKLIDQGPNTIAVLGLTTGETLKHTATIYEEAHPTKPEKAAIDVAELASERPTLASEALEIISDTLHIPTGQSIRLVSQFSDIGFLDSEDLGDEKILFNGNLFRKDEIKKINGVLSALSSSDDSKVQELFDKLDVSGCVSKEEAAYIVGPDLLRKLASIAFIDINTIGNEQGTFSFVTRPAAFKKYSSAIIDDAFDLAKAFVTSLTFGMTKSRSSRGRIRMIEALMLKLIAGAWVGPATAIGQDYKILELKGVIQVEPANGGMFHMRLLKRDVGEIAFKVISEGEASSSMMAQFPPVSATRYSGPEPNRTIIRKRQSGGIKRGISSLLNDLRTGEIR